MAALPQDPQGSSQSIPRRCPLLAYIDNECGAKTCIEIAIYILTNRTFQSTCLQHVYMHTDPCSRWLSSEHLYLLRVHANHCFCGTEHWSKYPRPFVFCSSGYPQTGDSLSDHQISHYVPCPDLSFCSGNQTQDFAC